MQTQRHTHRHADRQTDTRPHRQTQTVTHTHTLVSTPSHNVGAASNHVSTASVIGSTASMCYTFPHCQYPSTQANCTDARSILLL
eukprot:326136-Rhodomonas_salina.1